MIKWILLCLALSVQLSAEVKVLAFAGSTRDGSVNQKLILEAAAIAKGMNAETTVINLKDYPIPLYEGDLESAQGMPENAKKLRQLMVASDVILIASPEYNASVSGLLKNAIDWASRSETGGSSREAFKGKKFVIMSATPGAGGGARGLTHLRAIIEAIGGTVTAEVTVPDGFNAFDEQGHLKNPQLKLQLQKIIETTIKSFIN